MVVTSDNLFVSSQATWEDSSVYLKDLNTKDLPTVARIVKGQYMGLGVPSLPSPSLSQVVLLSTQGQRCYLSAQCVKFKEKSRHALIGPKMAIPETFDGYFEILNENGHAVKCIESVAELYRRFPYSCLVRENTKGYCDPSWSEGRPAIVSADLARILYPGEVLTLCGEVTGPSRNSRQEGAKYLRCLDSKNESVFLPLEMRGKFSAIAKEENISGVHTIKTLLSKRLPLMVRLVHGRPPITSGVKNILQNFCPEMRLFAVVKEECILGLPLSREGPLVILPPTLPIKLQLASNLKALQTKELTRIEEKTKLLYCQIKDRIQVFDSSFTKSSKSEAPQWRFPPLLKRSSTEIQIVHHRQKSTSLTPLPDLPPPQEENEECLREYDDIDQIYDYVRGFAPLPRHVKSPYDWSDSVSAEIYQRQQSADFRTRPSRTNVVKLRQRKGDEAVDFASNSNIAYLEPDPVRSAGKRTRRALDKDPSRVKEFSRQISTQACIAEDATSHISAGKIYSKSHKRSAVHRILKTKPVKENVYVSQPTLQANVGRSPLFRIRYKSLTNLLQGVDSDTLNSSNSGGNGSKNSAGGLPEKRLRRLSRPRSLTDLVWDLKNQHVHQVNYYMT
ncbi:hypothetical protein QYM36_002264 [Artemia franciscana]|uniref:CABIT domain-containing protein n=1 Tax=Artemia franciscana TaxID=6661 RepID=A0AA88I4G7_ARTSF|nr:hypothetical protein QYM36_002264 [Artemia franciscana]